VTGRVAGRSLLLAAAMVALVSPWAPDVSAHPLAPALLEIHEEPDGRLSVAWKTSLLKVPGSDLRPLLPDACEPVGQAVATESVDSVTTRWTVDCGGQPLVGARIAINDLEGAKTDVLARVQLADGRVVNRVLRASAPELVVPERESTLAVMRGYTRLGVEHILTGTDHLLFVFGLMMLVATTRSLIATITAFTLGHSITLSLAVLELARVPSGPVEVLIAFTVFLLAVELARGTDAPATLLRRYPWMMAAVFGLVHGLGFAGALREVGLPSGEIPVALFAFNVGIEIGQLAFVLVLLVVARLAGSLIERLPRWRDAVPAYVLGSLAAAWMFERAAALF